MLQHCQDTRFVWNIGLEQRSMWSQARRFYAQKINFATQSRELAELRAELDWVGEGSSAVQQGALRDLDTAFTNFFEKRADYPAFKKRDSRAGSFVVRDLKVRRVNHPLSHPRLTQRVGDPNRIPVVFTRLRESRFSALMRSRAPDSKLSRERIGDTSSTNTASPFPVITANRSCPSKPKRANFTGNTPSHLGVFPNLTYTARADRQF